MIRGIEVPLSFAMLAFLFPVAGFSQSHSVNRSVRQNLIYPWKDGSDVLDLDSIFVSDDCRHVAFARSLDSAETIAAQNESERLLREDLDKNAKNARAKVINKNTAKLLGPAIVGHDSYAVVVDGRAQAPFVTVLGILFSPNGAHVAYCGERNGKTFAVLDGIPIGTGYDYISSETLTFSPNSSRFAFIGRTGSESAKACVMVDGQAQGLFESIASRTLPQQQGERQLFFSPDGARLVYAARREGKEFLVDEGREGSSFDEIRLESLTFNPDGKHYLYAAKRGNKNFLIVDEQERPTEGMPLRGTIVFSPDGQHVAYAIGKGPKTAIFLDGTRTLVEGHVVQGSPRFSPDSRQFAYVLRGRNTSSLVLDAQAGKRYRSVERVSFSPDSRHIAYTAITDPNETNSSRVLAVIDGKEQEGHSALSEQNILFSPDSQHVAYAAGKARRDYIVVDGKPGPVYGEIKAGTLLFSPDSTRFAFITSSSRPNVGPQTVVVIDGRPQKPYDGVLTSTLIFSPDSKHLAYIARSRFKAGSSVVVVDGIEGEPFDGLVLPKARSRIIFDAPNLFHYLVDSRKGLTLFEETIN